ncbi:MAG TPA: hypothetical protein DEG06_11330 [Lachnospiraceae bacterium]|nr:hypothetical protein [Lachnospiraceae bacterium]
MALFHPCAYPGLWPDGCIFRRFSGEGSKETYFQKGGTQLMITVASTKDLKDAMVHPELYSNLFVRVGGYSGRFISLPRDVQLDILRRTTYEGEE